MKTQNNTTQNNTTQNNTTQNTGSWYGLALLPDTTTTTKICNYQHQHQHQLTGPTLKPDTTKPHITILQAPLQTHALTIETLQKLKTHQPPLTGTFEQVIYEPVGWIFMTLKHNPTLQTFQQAVVNKLAPYIDHSHINEQHNNGVTIQEREHYSKYGYRYVGECFKPHVTLGRTIPGTTSIPADIRKDFSNNFGDTSFDFDYLAFYRMGDSGCFAECIARIPL